MCEQPEKYSNSTQAGTELPDLRTVRQKCQPLILIWINMWDGGSKECQKSSRTGVTKYIFQTQTTSFPSSLCDESAAFDSRGIT